MDSHGSSHQRTFGSGVPRSRIATVSASQPHFVKRQPQTNVTTNTDVNPFVTGKAPSPNAHPSGSTLTEARRQSSPSPSMLSPSKLPQLSRPKSSSGLKAPFEAGINHRPASPALSNSSEDTKISRTKPLLARSQQVKSLVKPAISLTQAWDMAAALDEARRTSPSPAPASVIPSRIPFAPRSQDQSVVPDSPARRKINLLQDRSPATRENSDIPRTPPSRPQTWGSKARVDRNWMQRAFEESPIKAEDSPRTSFRDAAAQPIEANTPKKENAKNESRAGTPISPVRDPTPAKFETAESDGAKLEVVNPGKSKLELEYRPPQRTETSQERLLRRLARRPPAEDNPVATSTQIEEKSSDAPTETLKRPPESSRWTRRELQKSASMRGTSSPRSGSAGSAAPSVKSSRSELDPICRIEGEQKLFAPQDTWSERGSTPASQPRTSDDEDLDDTPRAKPLLREPVVLPTPRVLGAFPDTPATLPVRKTLAESFQLENVGLGGRLDSGIRDASHAEKENQGKKADSGFMSSFSWSALSSFGFGSDLPKRSSLPVIPAPANDSTAVTTGAAARHLRSKSAPGRTRPRRAKAPVVNTAHIPSAKDDLRRIQKANNMDDSTLDNTLDQLDEHILQHESSDADTDDTDAKEKKLTRRLESVLGEIKHVSARVTQFQNEIAHNPKVLLEPSPLDHFNVPEKSKHEEHGEVTKPMQRVKSLVGKAFTSFTTRTTSTTTSSTKPATARAAASTPAIFGQVQHWLSNLPNPKLVWLVLPLLGYFLVESLMFERFGRRMFCGPDTRCDWAPLAPTTFGFATPLKLDEWITGGVGAQVARGIADRVGDVAANVFCRAHVGMPLTTPIAALSAADAAMVDRLERCLWRRIGDRRRVDRLVSNGRAMGWADMTPEEEAELARWAESLLKASGNGRGQGESVGREEHAVIEEVHMEEVVLDNDEDVGFIGWDEVVH